MIEKPPRANVSAIASTADANFRRRSPRGIALAASQAIFVAVTALLFVAWLTSSH